MSSIQERLQLKRVPLDTWNVREQLCLASAVVRSGDQNWMSVSRALKTVAEANRPTDWYSQKSCAAQYGALLEHVETPKRKKRNSEGGVETPQESILKRLTQERIAEIQKNVAELTQQYEQIKSEVTEARNPATAEDRLRDLWAGIDAAKRARERDGARRAAWLREREERRARAERTWRPPTHPPPAVAGAAVAPPAAPAPAPAPPASPLLTSLLKSSPVVTTPQHISHPANVVDSMSPSAGAPTLSMLLEKSAGSVSPQETKNAAIEHIKSQLQQIEQQLKAKGSTPPPAPLPPPPAPAPPAALDIDDIEIKAEDVYAFRDIDLHIPPVATMHKGPARAIEKPVFKRDDEVTPTTEPDAAADQSQQEVKEEPMIMESSNEDLPVDVETPPDEPASLEPPAQPEPVPEPEPAQEPAPAPEPDAEPPEARLSFPEVKFPTPEIKVIQDELTIKEEAKDPEPAAETEQDVDVEVDVEAVDVPAARALSVEPLPLEAEPAPEPEQPAAPEPAAAEPAAPPDTDPRDIPLPPDPEREPAEEVAPEPPLPPEPEVPPAEPEPVLEPQPQEPEDGEPPESETVEEPAEKTSEEIQNEEDVEDSIPLKEMIREDPATPAQAQAPEPEPEPDVKEELPELEDTHTETDDDTPMELSREEEKDGKKRRDYSRKKKPDSRTCSGSESAAEASAPESPGGDAERQHRLWRKSVMLVYSRICAHKYASLFLRPISDEEAPGYSLVVKRPMDLGALRRNIDSGRVRTTAQFQRDILLMLSNALMYNSSEHSVYRMTREMHDEAISQLGMLVAAQAHAELSSTPAAPPRRKRRRRDSPAALPPSKRHQH